MREEILRNWWRWDDNEDGDLTVTELVDMVIWKRQKERDHIFDSTKVGGVKWYMKQVQDDLDALGDRSIYTAAPNRFPDQTMQRWEDQCYEFYD